MDNKRLNDAQPFIIAAATKCTYDNYFWLK